LASRKSTWKSAARPVPLATLIVSGTLGVSVLVNQPVLMSSWLFRSKKRTR
jgi:hypothetical protein